MIQAPLHALSLDTSFLEQIEYFVRNFLASDVRIFLFIVMVRETIEAKQYQQRILPSEV